ncbi:MAG TPA: Crp/Fnr family transcriptional regulator [Nodularia sp. (in: cyanobacteria)]|nr:Crp/Fnr family transcriptional regulator [Nodularia sp. (in: cyanobacteria)]
MTTLSSAFTPPIRNQKTSFSSRSILPRNNDYLWKIEQGVVRIVTWHEDGTIVTLGLWGAGGIIGTPLSKTEPYQIECLTKVELSALEIQDSSELLQILRLHLQQTEELMVIRSHKTVEIMVAKLLEWLANRFGREVQEGRLIDLRLTHQDIAEIIGSTRVTITRVLQKLEEQGFIQRLRLHRIVLREEDIWHYEI